MTALFESIVIRGLSIPNRIWVSPMCQYSAVDGVIGSWHIQHLGSMAAGRPGLLIVESTGISPAGRISTGCTGIWNDEQVAKFREVTALVHSQNVPIGIQLNHSGRKGSTMPSWWEYEVARSSDGSWQTFAPSSIPLNGFPTPKELTEDEIAEIINDFAKAAKMSVQAGFDLIEIHGAYGYLIHQFLSPISNKRSDNYGGNFEGRARFLKEIIQKIRSVVPDVMPLLVRIPAQDWVDGGWTLDESIQLVNEIKLIGVDVVDIVSGGILQDAWGPNFEGSQVSFSAQIRSATGIKTAVGGAIADPLFANSVIKNEEADAVMIGTAILRNPHWPLLASESLNGNLVWPNQLLRAKK